MTGFDRLRPSSRQAGILDVDFRLKQIRAMILGNPGLILKMTKTYYSQVAKIPEQEGHCHSE